MDGDVGDDDKETLVLYVACWFGQVSSENIVLFCDALDFPNIRGGYIF
jgi:hypothetical protein